MKGKGLSMRRSCWKIHEGERPVYAKALLEDT